MTFHHAASPMEGPHSFFYFTFFYAAANVITIQIQQGNKDFNKTNVTANMQNFSG